MKKLSLFFGGLIIICFSIFTFSCNTTGVSPTYYSRLQIVNTLAGSSAINFTINSTKKNTSTITFPATSGYISVVPANTAYIQFQYNLTPTINLITADTVHNILKFVTDSSYSVFLTGTTSNYSVLKILDNLSFPALGKAKIRFVNASTDTTALDVTINTSTAYKKIAYKGVGPFIEVPAGTYEFKANKTGTSSTLSTLSNQVLADGKIYTLYAAGLSASTATNAVFGLSLITNLLPATK